MGRIFGLLLMVAALWVGLEVYTKGMDGAFDGRFASWDDPIESRYDRDVPYGTHLTPLAQSADAPSSPRRVPITEAVRQRVTGHMEEGARRREVD